MWVERSGVRNNTKLLLASLSLAFLALFPLKYGVVGGLIPDLESPQQYSAFLFLRSDAFPTTNLLFEGKTGPSAFHIKVGAAR